MDKSTPESIWLCLAFIEKSIASADLESESELSTQEKRNVSGELEGGKILIVFQN